MNIYVVVEGDVGEKRVYETWIPWVNPNLGCVNHIWEIDWDQFAVFSGHGYPQYFSVIDDAIQDVGAAISRVLFDDGPDRLDDLLYRLVELLLGWVLGNDLLQKGVDGIRHGTPSLVWADWDE